jgi:hypothetical protein
LSGDFNSWESGPKHAAPQNVRDVYRKQEERRDLWVLAIKVGLILAGAGAFVWHVMTH